MIDKITPRPADAVIDMLKEVGFEDTEAVVTSKNIICCSFCKCRGNTVSGY